VVLRVGEVVDDSLEQGFLNCGAPLQKGWVGEMLILGRKTRKKNDLFLIRNKNFYFERL
jgi:hypothetical protein